MQSNTEWHVCLLGQWGFSAKCISKAVRKYDGGHYSTSAIYSTLRSNGIRIKDYRDGLTTDTKARINQLVRTQQTKNIVKTARKKTQRIRVAAIA